MGKPSNTEWFDNYARDVGPIGQVQSFLATSHDDDGTLLSAAVSNALGGSSPFLYDTKTMWSGAHAKRVMQQAHSYGFGFLSDSTGNDVPATGFSGDWPYELGVLIAAAHAEYTVKHYLFSDTNQDYAAPTTIQTGTAGERYVTFVTGTSNSLELDKADISALGDLDISIRLACDDWTSGANQMLVCHYGASGNRSFRFYLSSTGVPNLETSADGSTLIAHSSGSAVGFTDGAWKWLRATLDIDNGSSQHVVKFYSSDDGAAWTQQGSTVTTSGATSLFDSTQTFEIGGRTGTAEVMGGKVSEVRLRSGIPTGSAPALGAPGPIVAPCFPEQWPNVKFGSGGAGVEPVLSGAPVLALVCGCVSGQGIDYLSNATRLPMLLAPYSLRSVFMATMHNDLNPTATDGGRGKTLLAKWTTWLASVKTQAFGASPIVVTENPRSAAGGNIRDQAMLREMLLGFANQQGVAALDAYQAFVNLGDYSAYINADGIHPTLATGVTARTGAQVWADYAYTALFAGQGA